MTPAYRPGRRSRPLRLGPSAPEAQGQTHRSLQAPSHARLPCRGPVWGQSPRHPGTPPSLCLCRPGVSSGDAEWQGAGGTVARTELALCLCCAPRTGPVRSGHKSVRRGSGPRPPCSARCLPRPRTCAGSFSKPAGPRWASRGGSGVAGSSPCWGKVGKDTGHPPWSQARRQRAKGTPGRRHGGDSEVPGRFAIGGGQQSSALEVSTA